jgi:nucleotide-binding universal stress UspA family protein
MRHIPVRRILVPIELGIPRAALLEYAVALAQQLKAELLFFSVIDSPTTVALIEKHPSSTQAGQAGFRAKLVADAKILLQAMVERAAKGDVRATGHAVVSEKVGQEVLREAKERQADLILLATEDQSRLLSFLFGEPSEEIAHRAPCPVLTIKAAGVGA